MPSRTYTGLNLLNYLVTPTEDVDDFNLSEGSPGQLTAIGHSEDDPVFVNQVDGDQSIVVTGDIDYAGTFPTIPANALITKIAIRLGCSFVSSVSSTGGANSINVAGRIKAELGALNGDILNDTNSGDGAVTVTVSGSDAFTTLLELEFDPPITLAELITDYTALEITLTGQGSAILD